MSNIYVGGGKSGAFGDLTVNGEITSPASQVTISSTIGGKSYSYTKTLDTSGKAVFKGLLQGTWNVSMTDGTQTATSSATITTDYSKQLDYIIRLYWHGTLMEDFGGFSKFGTSATSYSGTELYVPGHGEQGSCITTNKGIDFTPYRDRGFTKMIFKGNFTNMTGTQYCHIGVSDMKARTALWNDDGNHNRIKFCPVPTGDKTTLTLDLSQLTGNYLTAGYICLNCASTYYIHVTEIYLEK